MKKRLGKHAVGAIDSGSFFFIRMDVDRRRPATLFDGMLFGTLEIGALLKYLSHSQSLSLLLSSFVYLVPPLQWLISTKADKATLLYISAPMTE